MTRLLVSVRNAAEAEVACTAGADLIDVKEPARGPLGAADAAVIEAVVATVRGRLPVSVALGELPEDAGLADDLAGRVQYAKFGLAGCGDLAAWIPRWRSAIERLPQGVAPVAVAYADWRPAAAPDPRAVLDRAGSLACRAILLDTFDKSGGPLTEHVDWEDLAAFISAAGARGLLSVVAGGLDVEEITRVLQLSPDYVAVRGAACAGDRRGRLDATRVRRLAALVHGWECGAALGIRGETAADRVVARVAPRLDD